MPIRLGARVKDLITGYTGVAVGQIEHLYGCLHIIVEGPLNRGRLNDRETFDEQRCEFLEMAIGADPIIPTLPLGARARDRVTGFEGMIIARTTFMFDQPSYYIEPTTLGADGKPRDGSRFEEPRVEIIEAKAPPVSADSSNPPGGPSTRF